MKEQLLQAIEAKRPGPGQTSVKKVRAEEYFDSAQFQREWELTRRYPIPAAMARDLSEEHTVLAFSFLGVSYLLTRAEDGRVRGFINSCSHRGTRLLGPGRHECKRAMVCPYHNWVFDLKGKRIATPHGYGFSDDIPGLREVEVIERHEVLWLRPFNASSNSSPHAQPPELNFIPRDDFAEWTVYRRTEAELACNWKLIVEGGLEFYHFKATHMNTIYPRFFDNQGLVTELDSTQGTGLVMHLPHRGILEEVDTSRPESYCHLVYHFFPNTLVLVEDHLVNIIRIEPLATDRTRITTLHVVPFKKRHLTRYWDKRIDFTMKTLDEDNQRTTWIQEGLAARDPERWVHHGDFEYGLGMFHEMLRERLG